MSKRAEATRSRIIQSAAAVFNKKGFFGASMADLMQAAGLQKGGLYNHFSSKEELALSTFDYAASLILGRFRRAVDEQSDAVDKLLALAQVFNEFNVSFPIGGGCPLLNTACESDDAHPALRKRVRKAMDDWRELIGVVVTNGVARGEIRSDADGEVVSTRVISTLEGSVVLGRLYRKKAYVERAVEFVCDYLRTLRP